MILYNILLFVCTACLWPILLLGILVIKKRRETVHHRLWLSQVKSESKEYKALTHPQPVWIHALSVGEVLSSVPLVHGLMERYPGESIVFTASTQTGFQIAQHQFKQTRIRIFFFPLDFHFAVKKAAAYINPKMVVLIETDLWPNFLNEMRKRHVPVVLANARLSRNALRGYRRFSFFFMPMLLSLNKICVQSETDLKRYQRMGIPGDKLTLTGNLKFDQAIPPFTESKKMALMQSIGLSSKQDIIVAGSTHEGEEKILLSVLGELKLTRPNLRLVLAPRDPKRSAAVCRLSESMGHVTLTLTSVTASLEKPGYDVLVVDVIGALRELYAISDIAFVGGSLAPCSGHNPLEPAAHAKPVLFGPDMNDFLDISKMMTAHNGAIEVTNENSLTKAIAQLLSDPSKAVAMGRCAYDTFRANAGAVEKTIMEISNLF